MRIPCRIFVFAAAALLLLPAALIHAQVVDTVRIKENADRSRVQGDTLAQARSFTEAIRLYQSALTAYQQIGDKAAEAAVFNALGGAFYNLQNYSEALFNYQRRLNLELELGNRKGEGEALNFLGVTCYWLPDKPKAQDYFLQSLKIAQEIGYRKLEGGILLFLGRMQSDVQKYDQALATFKQGLEVFRAIGDKNREARIMQNMALVYYYLSDYNKALDANQKCLAVFTELNDEEAVSYVISNLGLVFVSLGDHAKALEYHQKAMELNKPFGDLVFQGRSYINIAESYSLLHEYPKALECNLKALEILENVGDKRGAGYADNNLGNVYIELGNDSSALEYFQRSLATGREVDDKSVQNMSLANMGLVYSRQKNFARAARNVEEALSIARKIGSADMIQDNLNIMAACYAAQGLDSLAIVTFKLAIETAEGIRGQLNVEAYKSSYAAKVSGTYEKIALLLLKRDQAEEAFNYCERGKARSFLDLLASVPVKIGKPRHQEFLAKDRNYHDQKQQTEQQMAAAEADTAKVFALRGKLSAEWENALNSMEETKRQEPELASLVSVNALTLPEVQKQLDNQTTLLEYFLTQKKLLLWLVSSKQTRVYQIDVGGDSLKTLVMTYRKMIEAGTQTEALSRRLYDLLVAPAAGQIRTDNLVVVPHGILHYLPFATLQDTRGRVLLETYRISYLPSASVLKYLPGKNRSSGQKILALGNPATARPGYDAIAQAEVEAHRITAAYPESRVLAGSAATEGEFKTLAPQFDILHLACHSDMNAAYPLYSCLLLAPGSRQE
jgi:tetratricopeptide (TPR) repeat protein